MCICENYLLFLSTLFIHTHDTAGVGDDEAGALPRLVHRPGQPRPLQPGRLRRVRRHRGGN